MERHKIKMNIAKITDAKKERIKKFIIGLVVTFLTAIVTRLVTVAMESESASEVMIYIKTNYSFIWSVLFTSGVGGYFAQHWTGRKQ